MIDKNHLDSITGTAERVRYFDTQQEGGRPAGIIWQGFIIWEDGSHREYFDAGVGLLMDVSWVDKNNPNDVRELLCFQRRYAERKLEDSVKLFEAMKDELKTRAQSASFHGNIPPDQGELKQLRKLRHHVRQWESKLNKILEELNPKPQEITYTEEEQQTLRQNRTEAEKVLSALENLEV